MSSSKQTQVTYTSNWANNGVVRTIRRPYGDLFQVQLEPLSNTDVTKLLNEQHRLILKLQTQNKVLGGLMNGRI